MKKLLALLLAVFLLAALGGAAYADDLDADIIYTEGTLLYTISNDSVTIVDCFGKDAEVTVPAMIAGYPVNTIASGAFAENEHVQTLYLPDTITTIEPGAIGDWIYVVYNANTDHPQDTPTDLILGLLDPVPPAPESDPEPVEGPGEGQGTVSAQVGSSSEDLDEQPQPSTAPREGTVVSEVEVDLDEQLAPAATEAPADDETQSGQIQPSDAPEEKSQDLPRETEGDTAPEKGAEDAATVKPGVGPLLALGIVAVLAGGAALYAKRRRSAQD